MNKKNRKRRRRRPVIRKREQHFTVRGLALAIAAAAGLVRGLVELYKLLRGK